ncbi:hypothetical protein CHGG_03200 [Chaetomium globosum CBS 148.51]|uniref:Uncharacterized protein n=1 Tax=Chaetomium globosum (strain ATCC 6205 / CBS 148.51 / DSM 1962 / NBRC 6347 / NRRL 1970) TaxID=306901 RepID=Q2H9A4_CHAGB|nr:uncharacterized protein CHGG_03200 [Chaetomium globosum CBS 148.51]EAQ91265.1 hypothetical protein CHGG_03200 [Chaetomium globosum CBS 148.51]
MTIRDLPSRRNLPRAFGTMSLKSSPFSACRARHIRRSLTILPDVLRSGVFKSPRRGPMDFNTDILAATLAQSSRSFRLRMAKRPELKKAPSFALVARQVEILEHGLNDTVGFKDYLNTGQKTASRLFFPVIASGMAGAYTYGVEERGTGCFKRIKAHVVAHVKSVRDTMFKAAAQKVERALNHTINRLGFRVTTKVDKFVDLMKDDYSSLLVDLNIFKALSSSRDQIRALLSQADQQFEQVLRPIKREDTAAMDVDYEASATTPDPGKPLKIANSGCGSSFAVSANGPTSWAADGTL